MHFCGQSLKLYRILPFPQRLLQASGNPNDILGKIDETLENKHPVWLDAIIVVT